MCLFGGGGGGSQQPQVIYKDAPLAPIPAPMPTLMNSGVAPANVDTSNVTDGTAKNVSGTSLFKINRDPGVDSSEYEDQGLDSGLYY
jgi:hypothetical protein